MLHIHYANRHEALTARLLQQLAQPSDSEHLFVPQQVIVPSMAVRRAVTLDIARTLGVCTNVRFDFLAQWLFARTNGQAAGGQSSRAPFAADSLVWRVLAAFEDPTFLGAHPRLLRYLSTADNLMGFELAGRTAALLEQYTTYRPDWLQRWADGQAAQPGQATSADEAWQAALWRRLLLEVPTEHPQSQALQASALVTSAALAGPAAHVFALPGMAPLHWDWLQQLAQTQAIHLYVVNPCQEHWFDLVNRRRLSQLAARGQDQGFDEGNRLLTAWGAGLQQHLDAVVNASGGSGSGSGSQDDEAYQRHPDGHLLAQLHNAILELTPLSPGSLHHAQDDRSVELHVCHSLTRELEVLHDRLLGLFDPSRTPGQPRLLPSQVLVVLPDLDKAAPLIDAVFGTAPSARRIPYAITGRSGTDSNGAAQATLALLRLASSRMGASQVFALLAQPLVAARFGLDETGVSTLQHCANAAGARWGLDAQHRASFDVPAAGGSTWQAALDRLMLGYASASRGDTQDTPDSPDTSAPPFAGLLPSGTVEGNQALALGALARFIGHLGALQAATAQARPAPAWAALMQQTLPQFLPVENPGDAAEDIQAVLTAVRDLADTVHLAGYSGPLPWAVWLAALECQLDDAAHGGVAGGAVTFAAMSPLRGLPFEVVCVLGLDDGAYPSTSRPLEFDLMAQHPRRGDRQRGQDERGVFLDLLLAARRCLHLSHSGRSATDNSARPPSVLVAELLDVLVPAITIDTTTANGPATLAQARLALVVEHALQPFSITTFSVEGDMRLRSYDQDLAAALQHSATASSTSSPSSPSSNSSISATRLSPPADSPNAWADELDEGDDSAADTNLAAAFFAQPLSAPEPAWQQVTLPQLCDFFRNPSRFLLRRRLRLELPWAEEAPDDHEAFVPDRAARDTLVQHLLPALLRGQTVDDPLAWAQASGHWPAAALGRAALDNEWPPLQGFAQRVRLASTAPVLPPFSHSHSWDVAGTRYTLNIHLTGLRASGLLRWAYHPARPSTLVEAWLHHLALCLAAPPGAALQTTWLSTDEPLLFKPVTDPARHWGELLALYAQGLVRPLHFFPRSALALVRTQGDLGAAARSWHATTHAPFAESADPHHRLALRGVANPLNDDFVRCAQTVFGPLLEHLDGQPG